MPSFPTAFCEFASLQEKSQIHLLFRCFYYPPTSGYHIFFGEYARLMQPPADEMPGIKSQSMRAKVYIRPLSLISLVVSAQILSLVFSSQVLLADRTPLPGADPAEVFGVAHVDGKYFLTKEDYLNEGAGQVLATGSKVIKLYLTPDRYPWNSAWPGNMRSLVDVAESPYFKSVFAKPFRTYFLTVYSMGRDDHYWTDGVTEQQAADETRQFHELTKYFLTAYKGTGKTFVLQHWEGDWAIRRGAPKSYDASYVPSSTAIKGMIDWLNARQAGIVKARDEFGTTDVRVYGATEANRVLDSMAGKPGVINSVLPHTTVDLVSYSSYESLDTAGHLANTIDYISAHLPSTATFGQNAHSIYLGEFGYPENGSEGVAGVNRCINNALSVVKDKGMPWAIFWEIYCNEPINESAVPPLNGKGNDKNLRGFWMIKPDGTPAMAWHRYRRLFSVEDPKSNLVPAFTDDFNRPDGTDLGPGWTEAAHYGVVNKRLADHQMRFDIPDGKDIPWGSATLNLADHNVLGRGLAVGDCFEITLQRLSEQGGLGIELSDPDQLRVGSDLSKGPSGMRAWNGTTWVDIAFDDRGSPIKVDWNSPHTVEVRFDSADGYRTTFSYYIDGRYAASWLITTKAKTLDKIGVYAQSRTGGADFKFSGLKVFCRR